MAILRENEEVNLILEAIFIENPGLTIGKRNKSGAVKVALAEWAEAHPEAMQKAREQRARRARGE